MAPEPLLDCGEIATGEPVTASVVWLHGLGADGHDFEPIVPQLHLAGRAVRYVFPHAPVRPVTLNMGMAMRAWYDIVSLDRSGPQDEAGIRDSARQVRALLARERERGVPSSRTILAGFSQGGAIALHTALRLSETLAGVIALSTWLPLSATLDAEADPANAGTPVFFGHGTEDPMVPAALGRGSHDLLGGRGQPVEWHDYPMPHAVCAQEIDDLRGWLAARLGGALA